jgi:Calcineurin-like phosphoesterase
MHKRLLLFCLVFVAMAALARVHDGAIWTMPVAAQQSAADPKMALPNAAGSLKFAVLGDFGTGERAQYELAEQMARLRERFMFEFVILVGGNIDGSARPQDFLKKFEMPYKPLLDAGVTFHASLGKDDSREQRYYKLFNMGGKLYYPFSPRPDVRFFALNSTDVTPDQVQWLEEQLQASSAAWKIAFFHQPLYSSGERQGSGARLRSMLEPLFVRHNVSVALTGQDHFYERVNPQQGIVYFVVGSGGQLRPGHLNRTSSLTAKGFDQDQAFMAAEIIGDQMFFAATSRTGATVDSGVLRRRSAGPVF